MLMMITDVAVLKTRNFLEANCLLPFEIPFNPPINFSLSPPPSYRDCEN